MRFFPLFLILICAPMVAGAAVETDDPTAAIRSLAWHVGPQTEDVAAKATLKTDASQAFLDEENTKKFLQLTGNLPQPGHFVLLSAEHNWWAAFSFRPTGYIKDDEQIDADALLQQLKDGDAAANEERKRLGLPLMYTEGWYVPPHYDAQSKRLEWGLKLNSDGHTGLNYTVRLLGRTGVMNATLVSEPATFDADVKSFKSALPGLEFNSGERYAEYKPGDRVAEFGLAALIAGGAAAIATKKGLWGVIAGFFAVAWKFIVAAALGLAGWLGSLFKKKS